MRLYFIFMLFMLPILEEGLVCAQTITTPVAIIGGGASGTMAAIQCARMGVACTLIEEGTWLGGMLTSAGVSAIDGNHKMPSGLWGEFRDSLYAYYGGASKVETGWVSNTLFEPHIGQRIISNMVSKEANIKLMKSTSVTNIKQIADQYQLTINTASGLQTITANVVIDATELGDVLDMLCIKKDVGMDASSTTEERWAPSKANDIVQDLTYVAILKDYGSGVDKTIARPKNYDATHYKCCCDTADPSTKAKPKLDCAKMMTYGKLPNNKYMINWPKCGNDFYLNLMKLKKQDRAKALEAAKEYTLGFVYFIQTELGYASFGLADNEYPTADKLPFIPYHRESGRVKGLVQFNANQVLKPYDYTLYKTGIAVGDYPIDHHHLMNKKAPVIDFFEIKAPSYNVPMGALIPKNSYNIIAAEKSISVTNIVNGATRLQPVVLGIGQAAGMIAALAIKLNKPVMELNAREVQSSLLTQGVYIMPYIDVPRSDTHFVHIQRMGAAGVIKGVGVPYLWANQTWFYPEKVVSAYELVDGLRPYYNQLHQYYNASGEPLSLQKLVEVVNLLGLTTTTDEVIKKAKTLEITLTRTEALTRRQVAVLVDEMLKVFEHPITITGATINKN